MALCLLQSEDSPGVAEVKKRCRFRLTKRKGADLKLQGKRIPCSNPVSTYSGVLASARLFIGWQQSQTKLLSCVCLSWVCGTFTLVYLCVFLGLGMRGLRTRHKELKQFESLRMLLILTCKFVVHTKLPASPKKIVPERTNHGSSSKCKRNLFRQ